MNKVLIEDLVKDKWLCPFDMNALDILISNLTIVSERKFRIELKNYTNNAANKSCAYKKTFY